jgi:hypothetical protein
VCLSPTFLKILFHLCFLNSQFNIHPQKFTNLGRRGIGVTFGAQIAHGELFAEKSLVDLLASAVDVELYEFDAELPW